MADQQVYLNVNPSLESGTTPQALTACKDGECFLVQVVQGMAAARLRDVGVREGALLNMVKNRGSVVLAVDGCRVCLREEVARLISGELVDV